MSIEKAQHEMYCLSQEIDGLYMHIHHCKGHASTWQPLDLSKVPLSRRETRQCTYDKKKALHDADMARLYAQLHAYEEEYREKQRRFDAALVLVQLSEAAIQCKPANISH